MNQIEDEFLDSLSNDLCKILRKRSVGEDLTGKEIILSLIYREELKDLTALIEEKMKQMRNVSRVTDSHKEE